MNFLGRQKASVIKSKIDLRVLVRITKIVIDVSVKEIAKIYWVRAVIKRGSHTQLTKGYTCKNVAGKKNSFEVTIP
jgi:hypothetical protein